MATLAGIYNSLAFHSVVSQLLLASAEQVERKSPEVL